VQPCVGEPHVMVVDCGLRQAVGRGRAVHDCKEREDR
jgi:hypothetical protein